MLPRHSIHKPLLIGDPCVQGIAERGTALVQVLEYLCDHLWEGKHDDCIGDRDGSRYEQPTPPPPPTAPWKTASQQPATRQPAAYRALSATQLQPAGQEGLNNSQQLQPQQAAPRSSERTSDELSRASYWMAGSASSSAITDLLQQSVTPAAEPVVHRGSVAIHEATPPNLPTKRTKTPAADPPSPMSSDQFESLSEDEQFVSGSADQDAAMAVRAKRLTEGVQPEGAKKQEAPMELGELVEAIKQKYPAAVQAVRNGRAARRLEAETADDEATEIAKANFADFESRRCDREVAIRKPVFVKPVPAAVTLKDSSALINQFKTSRLNSDETVSLKDSSVLINQFRNSRLNSGVKAKKRNSHAVSRKQVSFA